MKLSRLAWCLLPSTVLFPVSRQGSALIIRTAHLEDRNDRAYGLLGDQVGHYNDMGKGFGQLMMAYEVRLLGSDEVAESPAGND